MLFAWLAKFHVSPPAELAHAIEALGADRFERLYRGYACYAEINR